AGSADGRQPVGHLLAAGPAGKISAMPEPLTPASTAAEAIARLSEMGNDENRAGMARFGIETGTALGIGNTDLRRLARDLKRNHERALELWRSGVREARLLAAFTDEPDKVGIAQCREWA